MELNIQRLIETPIDKLSKTSNSKFISKMFNYFSTEEQQLFAMNFYFYLNCKNTDFVINIKDIWKWLGYTRIDHCKTLLLKIGKENIDYIICKNETETSVKGGAGKNKENVVMTVDCFKKLCLKSRTDKADEIHNYYIKMEELLNNIVNEEIQELKLENENLKKEVDDKIEEIICALTDYEKNLLKIYSNMPVLYMGHTEEDTGKFGTSFDLERRLKEHKRYIGQHFTFERVVSSVHYINIEREMKKNEVIKSRMIEKVYNGKKQTELVLLDDTFTIDHLFEIVISIKNKLEEKEKTDLIIKVKEQEEELEEKEKELKKKESEINKLSKENFIAKNIKTGEVREFTSYKAAYDISKIGPHSVKDNYLNKPYQNRGWVFHERNMPYWNPPDNYYFDPEYKSTTNMVRCKSIHKESGVIQYYNSIIEAAKFHLLDETRRRTVNDQTLFYMDCKTDIVKDYEWYAVELCGSWVYPDGNIVEIEDVVIPKIDKKKYKIKELKKGHTFFSTFSREFDKDICNYIFCDLFNVMKDKFVYKITLKKDIKILVLAEKYETIRGRKKTNVQIYHMRSTICDLWNLYKLSPEIITDKLQITQNKENMKILNDFLKKVYEVDGFFSSQEDNHAEEFCLFSSDLFDIELTNEFSGRENKIKYIMDTYPQEYEKLIEIKKISIGIDDYYKYLLEPETD